MKQFAMFLAVAALAAGVVWYESKPATIRVPVRVAQSPLIEPEITQPPTTLAPRPITEIDFSKPDVIMQIRGLRGDDLDLLEVIGKPQALGELPGNVQQQLRSCPGVTDRDMAVKVVVRLEMKSALAATIMGDYHTLANPSVFNFQEGLACSDGSVKHNMHPGRLNQLEFWVDLNGVISPDHPDGDFTARSWLLQGPTLTLPNMEPMTWKVWGRRVVSCSNLVFGDSRAPKIWLAGPTPKDCESITAEDHALGTP